MHPITRVFNNILPSVSNSKLGKLSLTDLSHVLLNEFMFEKNL